ncbi:response regulator transcription factor [Ornithinimicrobium cerasi]|uniref:DNA-binding response regulator, NarL/FixJ family, contains REC and HTH domains n=1 Tax=Ornithinimicrobium cerasi TaxID=2248773 RepID=A0A285VDN8_9MICO|nr:response regulator transcription factor [Ornithinimicrobium cerasi]SOC52235.1 DNA-binding response regulator, NarL/FixJ family, contains REC and HTH domains [Ornithinimicrobium cerasi]
MSTPVDVAIVNDYEVVVHGVAAMLEPYADRVRVAELDMGRPPVTPVDVTLYDTFAQAQVDGSPVELLVNIPGAGRVVVYSWNIQAPLVALAIEKGCSGYLPKSARAAELVEAIERIAAGEVVVPGHSLFGLPPSVAEPEPEPDTPWPGKEHGLSARESEVISLITQGLSNEEIATRSYLTINTVKSYIRTAYRKIGVTRRAQAVRWGVEHGMLPTRQREIDPHHLG